jgi:hypothetical protein
VENWPSDYKALENKNFFSFNDFSLIPIRYEDRYQIMEWRNEQIYHLRQEKVLSKQNQDNYFKKIVFPLFNEKYPKQILFSFLKSKKLVGYGGLVHINRQLKRAEISFVINTSLEKKYFFEYWDTFLKLIEQIALNLLDIKNIFTYAFDLRPELYEVLNANNFVFVRDEKYIKSGQIIDVKIHNKKIRNE